MATTQKTIAPDQRFVLYDVSWETYERLLADYRNHAVPHFTYDDGVLEMARPSLTRERTKLALVTLVGTIAEEIAIDLECAGSTTFERADLRRGFEADSSFSIQHAPEILGKDEINLPDDPPPDLVIDIDANDRSTDLPAICASLGVPELWRYEAVDDRVVILRLRDGKYRTVIESAALQPLTRDVLTQYIRASRGRTRTDWLRDLRAWIRNYDREERDQVDVSEPSDLGLCSDVDTHASHRSGLQGGRSCSFHCAFLNPIVPDTRDIRDSIQRCSCLSWRCCYR